MKQTKKISINLLSFSLLLLLGCNTIYSQSILPTPNFSIGGAGMAALTYPFFPIRHQGGANLFWGQNGSEFLKVSSISGNLKTGAIYSELYSGFIKDIVRVGLGTTLAAAENDTTGSVATLQRQISGGGLMTLSFQYPIFAIPFKSNFGAGIILAPRLGADLPVAGNSTTKITACSDLGAELHLVLSTDDRKLIFPIQLRAAYVVGTKEFRNSINLQDNYGYLHFSGGIQYEILRINFGGIINGPSSIKSKIEPALSVSIVKAVN